MLRRFTVWFRQLLVSFDQLACVLIAMPFFVLLARGQCPSADETMSSRVGRAALRGRRWGIIAERLIDRVFVLLGEAPGHCRRNVESAFLGKAPTP